MSNNPTPRKAFSARPQPASRPQAAPTHPLNPDRKPERSPLAETPLTQFGTRIPADLAREIKVAAAQRGLSLQEVTEAALRAWLES